MRALVLFLTAVFLPAASLAQQAPDSTFSPLVPDPAWPAGTGPIVAIDEAHHNFHTIDGRYSPFAGLLAKDGYRMRAFRESFTLAALESVDVLVIANPLAARNETDWTLPTPSAFTRQEVASVREWVEGGGSLLLIADHMPFPGAAGELALAFGVTFSNGFATGGPGDAGVVHFRRVDGRLADGLLTRGRSRGEGVDSVVTFTGSAFQPDSTWESLLVLPPGFFSLEPDTAWQFSAATRRVDVSGWSQGAIRRAGKGRLAIFGEAAMFTAQIVRGGEKIGMNSPLAKQNPSFLLNVVRWLTGALDRG